MMGRIDDARIAEMFALKGTGMSQAEIARRLGLSPSAVSERLNRTGNDLAKPGAGGGREKDDIRAEVRKLRRRGYSATKIARIMGRQPKAVFSMIARMNG